MNIMISILSVLTFTDVALSDSRVQLADLVVGTSGTIAGVHGCFAQRTRERSRTVAHLSSVLLVRGGGQLRRFHKRMYIS